VAAVAGRATRSDSLIALGILGALLLFVAGVTFRFDYRGSGADYERWMDSRGRLRQAGVSRRIGLALMLDRLAFGISAGVGLAIN
jgi:hypothetical protein